MNIRIVELRDKILRFLFLSTDITEESLRKEIGNDVYSIMDQSVHSDWSVASPNSRLRRSSVVQNLRNPAGKSENGL